MMRRRVVFFAVFARVAGLLAMPATAVNPNGIGRGPRIDGIDGPGKSATAPGLHRTAGVSDQTKGPAGEKEAPTKGKPDKPVNDSRQLAMNVLLNTSVTDDIVAELNTIGRVRDTLLSIDAVFMQVRAGDVAALEALPYVTAVNPDAERKGSPIDTVEVEDFTEGLNTWNLDAINVTDFATCEVDGEEEFCGTRTVTQTGEGVYVAVLDTGLVDQWRRYFPEERIAVEYAKAFSGGGGERGAVPETPNVWEHDTNSHGTHVTSTILGYSLRGQLINGVAPMATVIPVKTLGNSGFGWSSMVAAGITYIGDLKAGPLADHPVVINMSLGGPVLDAVEKAAMDYAIAQGVIIVASAGNEGEDGMGYPGAYAPVISVAASGWIGEWQDNNDDGSFRNWWFDAVPDPLNPADFYITDFSSRELPGQDLDVAAPGSWVVGPYNVNQGQTSYFFLGGTSMASPHVAGVVALMAEKYGDLTAAQAETILEATAVPLAAGSRTFTGAFGEESYAWEVDATGAGLVTADAALAATP
jgi:subtilisin family serine protease